MEPLGTPCHGHGRGPNPQRTRSRGASPIGNPGTTAATAATPAGSTSAEPGGAPFPWEAAAAAAAELPLDPFGACLLGLERELGLEALGGYTAAQLRKDTRSQGRPLYFAVYEGRDGRLRGYTGANRGSEAAEPAHVRAARGGGPLPSNTPAAPRAWVERDGCRAVACVRLGRWPVGWEQPVSSALRVTLRHIPMWAEVTGGVEALRPGPARDLTLQVNKLHDEEDHCDELKRVLASADAALARGAPEAVAAARQEAAQQARHAVREEAARLVQEAEQRADHDAWEAQQAARQAEEAQQRARAAEHDAECVLRGAEDAAAEAAARLAARRAQDAAGAERKKQLLFLAEREGYTHFEEGGEDWVELGDFVRHAFGPNEARTRGKKHRTALLKKFNWTEGQEVKRGKVGSGRSWICKVSCLRAALQDCWP